MRHRKAFNHLGRTSSHRKAMLANMASSLILSKRINTTTAKAKALRPYLEPLITRAKEDTTHNRRVVFSYLQNKQAVSELFREIAQKIGERPGGYTRILKTESRLGDNADMCIIELVDYNENMLAAEKETKQKKKRTRRGSRKKSSDADAQPETKQEETAKTTQDEVKEETPKIEATQETEKPKAEPKEEKKEPKASKPEEKKEEKLEAKDEKKEEKNTEKKEAPASKQEKEVKQEKKETAKPETEAKKKEEKPAEEEKPDTKKDDSDENEPKKENQ